MCFENDARGTGLSPTVIIIHAQAVFVKGLGKICPYPCDTEAESKIVKMSKCENVNRRVIDITGRVWYNETTNL